MEWAGSLHLGVFPYFYLLGGYMSFDRHFIYLLKIGDIAAAKALLLEKYPHLKEDSDRIAMYILRYKKCEKLRLMLQ
jgi:hypothetical protein